MCVSVILFALANDKGFDALYFFFSAFRMYVLYKSHGRLPKRAQHKTTEMCPRKTIAHDSTNERDI